MCLQEAGQVRAAATVVGQPTLIRLTVRCDTCAHEWKIDKEAQQLVSPSLQRLQDETRC